MISMLRLPFDAVQIIQEQLNDEVFYRRRLYGAIYNSGQSGRNHEGPESHEKTRGGTASSILRRTLNRVGRKFVENQIGIGLCRAHCLSGNPPASSMNLSFSYYVEGNEPMERVGELGSSDFYLVAIHRLLEDVSEMEIRGVSIDSAGGISPMPQVYKIVRINCLLWGVMYHPLRSP